MILGDPKKIDLSISSFDALRSDNKLYVDKTRFIEHFLNEPNSVQLIVRQRRLGKSLNIDMLRCFLTEKEDNRALFTGTYIETRPVWERVNSSPVFLFDFKNLSETKYSLQIFKQIHEYVSFYVNAYKLDEHLRMSYEMFKSDPKDCTDGLLFLTEIVYKTTGKRSYILIDEYDKLLADNYNTKYYDEIKTFETHLFSAGLKGNAYLKKALLTGVMRVSRESMLSGLNNLVTYDLFSDQIYTEDFGLTDEEIDELQGIYHFDKA